MMTDIESILRAVPMLVLHEPQCVPGACDCFGELEPNFPALAAVVQGMLDAKEREHADLVAHYEAEREDAVLARDQAESAEARVTMLQAENERLSANHDITECEKDWAQLAEQAREIKRLEEALVTQRREPPMPECQGCRGRDRLIEYWHGEYMHWMLMPWLERLRWAWRDLRSRLYS